MRGDGSVAVVTGGTGWIGSAISNALEDSGFRVFTVSRGKSQNFLQFGQQLTGDLSTQAGCDEVYSQILDRTHCIDVLVNNSFSWPTKVHFLDQQWDDFKTTAENGLVSQLYFTKLIMKKMIDDTSGSIINICSMYGHSSPDLRIYEDSGMGNAVEYGAVKAAMLQSTRYLAGLGGPYGVRVNSISPGPISRPESLDGKEWFKKNLENKTMLGRIGTPEDIQGAAVLLATEAGSYITGTDIRIDGGWTAW